MVAVAKAPLAVLPNIGMSQSAVMVGALIGGFVVFLALNQKLGAYWSILIGGSASAAAPATTSATPSTSTGSTTSGSIPTTQGSVLGGLGGTTSTLPASGTQTGTVGYNALSGAGSGLTPGSAFLFSGVGD